MVDPIDPKHREFMSRLADRLAVFLAPSGFALLVFELDRTSPGRMHYISNAKRDDMIALMKEFIARNEGRMIDEPGTA